MKKAPFIFDLDGTIIDSQTRFHATAECIVLKKRGIFIRPQEISARFAGISTTQVFNELAPEHDAHSLILEKWETMQELTKKSPLEYLPGMYELLSVLKEKGIDIAIASASPMKWIETCLKNALPNSIFDFEKRSMLDMFPPDRIFSAENCKNSKPAPDVFLEAHASFGFPKDLEDLIVNTFVVGDGRADVLGGLAAGFNVLYLSEDNKEFDNNKRVKRFQKSSELSGYIISNLI